MRKIEEEIEESTPKYKDDVPLEKVVDTEYKKLKRNEFVVEDQVEDVDLLKKNQLLLISDWKRLTDARKCKYPDGLVMMLDKAAGIEVSKQLLY